MFVRANHNQRGCVRGIVLYEMLPARLKVMNEVEEALVDKGGRI